MTVEPDGSTVGLRTAEYIAATAQERAEWAMASDTTLDTVERVKAYARWLTAAERVKALSVRMGSDPNMGASVT